MAGITASARLRLRQDKNRNGGGGQEPSVRGTRSPSSVFRRRYTVRRKMYVVCCLYVVPPFHFFPLLPTLCCAASFAPPSFSGASRWVPGVVLGSFPRLALSGPFRDQPVPSLSPMRPSSFLPSFPHCPPFPPHPHTILPQRHVKKKATTNGSAKEKPWDKLFRPQDHFYLQHHGLSI